MTSGIAANPTAIAALSVLATTACLVVALARNSTLGTRYWCAGTGTVGLGLATAIFVMGDDQSALAPGWALSLIALGGVLKLLALNADSPVHRLQRVLKVMGVVVPLAFLFVPMPLGLLVAMVTQSLIWLLQMLLFGRLARLKGSASAGWLAVGQLLGFGAMLYLIGGDLASLAHSGFTAWVPPDRDAILLLGVGTVSMQILYVGYQFESREAERARLQARTEASEGRVGMAMQMAPYGDYWRKDALSGYLLHEISQPVTAMLTNAQLAQMQLDGQGAKREPAAESVDRLVRAGRHAKSVLDRIREQTRQRQRSVTKESLRRLVVDAAGLMEYECRLLQVSVSIQASPGDDGILVDRFEVNQVVLNLLRNSIDAVSMAARRRIMIAIRPGKGVVEMTIQDSGAGFADAVISNFGDPQESTKQNGTGLGLAIVKRIVEQNGGSAALETGEFGGACVRLSFPRPKAA